MTRFVALAAATVTTLGTLGVVAPVGTQNTAHRSFFGAAAAEFQALEVNQGDFLSVGIPGGSLVPYQLWLIRKRQPGANCFSVSGSNPGVVQPLWRDNPSGCAPTSDSNGYSIRVGGQDLGSSYSLIVQESNGELVLIGRPLRGRAITIGRSGGISSNGYTEIKLLPGWRITQRAYQGSPLGHFYYTNDLTLAELEAGEVASGGGETPRPDPRPPVQYPFPDIANDIYASEIAKAVELGFVSGFQDGTFKPTRPVTREEAVSMVVEALRVRGDLTIPQVRTAPFPDVPANRWSAPKIELLRQARIVTGDQRGNFRPTSTITRAELMSMLRRTAEVVASAGGTRPEEIRPTGDPIAFSDTQRHWNRQTISIMSAYCGVATPFNERGQEFRPDSEALRNYTAAAIKRLLDCGSTPPSP